MSHFREGCGRLLPQGAGGWPALGSEEAGLSGRSLWFPSSPGLFLLLLSGLRAGKFSRGTHGGPGCRRQQRLPRPPHSPSCFSRGPRRKAGPQARVVCRPEGHSGDADPETLRFSLDGVPGGVGGTSPRVSQSSAFQGRRELPALLAPWPRSVLGSPRSHSFQTARSRDVHCSRGRGLRAPARGWRGRGRSRPRCRQLRGCRRATPLWARPTSLLRGTSGLTKPLLKSRRVLLND